MTSDLKVPQDQTPRPGKKWTLILSGLISVFIFLAAYDLIAGGVGSDGSPSAANTSVGTHAAAPATSKGPPPAFPSPSAIASPPPAVIPSGSLSKPHSGTASGPAPHSLAIKSVTAVGPQGASDGDDPGAASRVMDGGAQPWHSSWYATAKFGNLQSGTGLLLDMGKAVGVSSVRLVLGSQIGASVDVRVGDTATLANLPTVATATDAGGTVHLSAAERARGEYVLIWFTTLPPNGQGKYQVYVYGVTVDGTAGA